MTSAERVAVVGTGLVGTSIAMAAVRAGEQVRGFDIDPEVLAAAAERSGLTPASTLEECVPPSTDRNRACSSTTSRARSHG